MAKSKKIEPAPITRRAGVPTRAVRKLRAGDQVYLPSEVARVVAIAPLKSRIPTNLKSARVLTFEIQSGPARGKTVEFCATLDDRVEIVTTPLKNRVANWLRRIWRALKAKPFG